MYDLQIFSLNLCVALSLVSFDIQIFKIFIKFTLSLFSFVLIPLASYPNHCQIQGCDLEYFCISLKPHPPHIYLFLSLFQSSY